MLLSVLTLCDVFRYSGKVAYVGPVHYAKGIFVGVITDDPACGKNNGMY